MIFAAIFNFIEKGLHSPSTSSPPINHDDYKNKNFSGELAMTSFEGVSGDLLAFKAHQNLRIDVDHSEISSNHNTEVLGFKATHNHQIFNLPRKINLTFPSLIALQIFNCSLMAIFNDAFQGLSNLEVIDLRHNKIEPIGHSTFNDQKKLKFLFLSHNNIKLVEPNSFIKLINLRSLHLDHNKLNEASFDKFELQNLLQLRNISLSHNNFTQIFSQLFKNNKNLSKIDLRGNQIVIIAKFSSNLEANLNFIDLRENKCIDESFEVKNLYKINNILNYNCSAKMRSPL